MFTLSAPVLAYDGFDTDGIKWQSGYATWNGSTLSGSWLTKVYSATNTWAAAGSDFYFSLNSSSMNDVTAEARGVLSAPGTTYSVNVTINGTTYCYIRDTVINTSVVTLDGWCNVESVALHELGHWLALKDLYNPGDYGNVMRWTYLGPLVNLGQGDINGINYLY